MNIDDVINHTFDKAACAEMAQAKGGEMTDEFKPCPLCKGPGFSVPRRAQIISNTFSVIGWVCGCVKCDLHVYGDDRISTERAWNTRPIEDELNARIAELEALIGRLVEVGELFSSGFEHDIFGVLANGIEAYGYDEGIVRGNEFLEEIQSRLNAIISEWRAMKGGEK